MEIQFNENYHYTFAFSDPILALHKKNRGISVVLQHVFHLSTRHLHLAVSGVQRILSIFSMKPNYGIFTIDFFQNFICHEQFRFSDTSIGRFLIIRSNDLEINALNFNMLRIFYDFHEITIKRHLSSYVMYPKKIMKNWYHCIKFKCVYVINRFYFFDCSHQFSSRYYRRQPLLREAAKNVIVQAIIWTHRRPNTA